MLLFSLASVISLLTLISYLPALRNGFVNWDDIPYILENNHIRSLDSEFMGWAIEGMVPYWHPLTWISHAVDYGLWGLNPAGHHLTNIIFHALNAGIAVWLAVRLLEVVNESKKRAGKAAVFDKQALLIAGGAAGLLFGIHPLHVESVAWISQRKDMLYCLLSMLAVLNYLRYARHKARTTGTGGTCQQFYFSKAYYATLTLFFLSLASKPMAVTLPVILLLLDWYPLERIVSRKSLPALIVEKIPFFVLSGAISLSTVLAHQTTAGGFISLEESPLASRTLVVFRGLMLYLWKIIAPFDLLPIYPYPGDISLADPVYLAAILLMSVITVACLLIAKKQPYWLAVWAFFIITLFPVLGFFHTGREFMADRFVYLGVLGPFILAGAGVARIFPQKKTILRTIAVAVAASLTVTLLYLTIKQIDIWRNTISLWSHYIERHPRTLPEAYFLRAGAFRDDHRLDRAIEDYTTAVSIDGTYAMAFFDRGEVFLETGRYDSALEDFNRVITLKPDFPDGHVGRGNTYLIKGQIKRALEEYNLALACDPGSYKAYSGRGYAYKSVGKFDKAIEYYSKALSLKPDLMNVYVGRGDLYLKTGAEDLALKDYQKACGLGNDLGCSNLRLLQERQPR